MASTTYRDTDIPKHIRYHVDGRLTVPRTPSCHDMITTPQPRKRHCSSSTKKLLDTISTRKSHRISSAARTRTPLPRMTPIPNRRLHCNNSTPVKVRAPSPYSCCYTPLQAASGDDDRFIPSRCRMNIDMCRRALLLGTKEDAPTKSSAKHQGTPLQKEYNRHMMSSLCEVPLEQLDEDGLPTAMLSFGSRKNHKRKQSSTGTSNITPRHPFGIAENPYDHDTLRTMMRKGDWDDCTGLRSTKIKGNRKINDKAYRIFESSFEDDFYINHISWGKNNIVAVASHNDVFLWNVDTNDTTNLFKTSEPRNVITSLSWSTVPGCQNLLAIGTNDGDIILIDVQQMRRLRVLNDHMSRVTSLAWCGVALTSGSLDTFILQHDMRCRRNVIHTYDGHQGGVCTLKWNQESNTLASGGNDNTVCLWDASMSGYRNQHKMYGTSSPLLCFTQHRAAIKALDWCPNKCDVLVSGGGNQDQTIKFWNTKSGTMIKSVDTGSQVASILWSKDGKELCSAHGAYENQLKLWKYPSMEIVKELDGHDDRILSMDVSPDATSVASISSDNTMQVWKIFEEIKWRFDEMPLGTPSFGMPTIR